MSWILARLELRSPITSPMLSSGVVTTTFITGSSKIGSPFLTASCKHFEAAILKAISEESTS